MAKKLPELTFGWPEIAAAMIWKLAPNGFYMPREAMFSLPTDRVLLEDRNHERIVLSFIPVAEGKRRTQAKQPDGAERATLSELQGRWQKIAVVALWHFARRKMLGKSDSLTLTPYDFAAVPADKALLAGGDGQSVEWRFIDHAEAQRRAKWDKDNEQKLILERMRT